MRTSSPRRKVWPRARKAVAAHSQATMSSAPRNSRPSSRMPAWASMTTAMEARQIAASAPLAAYRRSKNRRKLFLRAVGLQDLLTIGAGGLLPLLRHLLTDLGEGGLHRGIGITHAHAVLGERLVAFLLAHLRHL